MPGDKDFSLMTDGETAVLARNRDIAALEYIMGKYKPLVKLKSRQYYIDPKAAAIFDALRRQT